MNFIKPQHAVENLARPCWFCKWHVYKWLGYYWWSDSFLEKRWFVSQSQQADMIAYPQVVHRLDDRLSLLWVLFATLSPVPNSALIFFSPNTARIIGLYHPAQSDSLQAPRIAWEDSRRFPDQNLSILGLRQPVCVACLSVLHRPAIANIKVGNYAYTVQNILSVGGWEIQLNHRFFQVNFWILKSPLGR